MQKVQNQLLEEGAFDLVVEEAIDLESQSTGRGDACQVVSTGLKPWEQGEDIGIGLGLVGLRPDRYMFRSRRSFEREEVEESSDGV